jgi:hypothetical protein
MGVSGQRHAPAVPYPRERTPGAHLTGGWVGLRAGLDTEARGKILCPCWGSKPSRPVRSQTLYRLSYPSSCMKMAVFWNAAPCSLAEMYRRFRGAYCLHYQGDECRDDGASTHLRNVGLLRDQTALYPIMLSYLHILWSEHVNLPTTKLLLVPEC